MALVYGQTRDRQTAFLPSLKAGVSCLYEDEIIFPLVEDEGRTKL
jgi:hypothetical protein